MSLSGSDHSKSHSKPVKWGGVSDFGANKKWEGQNGWALTSIGYVRGTHDTTYLFHTLEIRAEAPVHGEDLLVNDRGDG